MIVRTYGRRREKGIGSRLISSTSSSQNDAVFSSSPEDENEDPFSFNEFDDDHDIDQQRYSFSQQDETSKFPQYPRPSTTTTTTDNNNSSNFNFTFSSQDSTRWTPLEEEETPSPETLQLLKPRGGKVRKLNDGRRVRGRESGVEREREREREVVTMTTTTTLMETQENGEMMECVDEVEFALDGLRNGCGERVRRASLLALLNVCGVTQQRRLLRAQGMAKTIVDAIIGLSLDDSPSNLAAATLFYILTSDDQDTYLLDSSSSISFLLKLLKPVVAKAPVKEPMSITQKLLALRKNVQNSHEMAKRLDSSSTSIKHKVRETLVSSKDLKASNVENDEISRPELNSDWISLLTIEKACLSTITIEDTLGTVKKSGGNFKDKLRELGGLDAVFELVIKFYSTLEGLNESVSPKMREANDSCSQCLAMLLRCLKIMENATFLSKENQSHLLRLKGNVGRRRSPLSFVKLMISFIRILSDLSFMGTSSATSSPEVPMNNSNGTDDDTEFLSKSEQKNSWDNYGDCSQRSSQECSSTGRYTSETGVSSSQSNQWLSSFQALSLPSNSGATVKSGCGNSLTERVSSSKSGSCSLLSRSSLDRGPLIGHSLKEKLGVGGDQPNFIDLDDSEESQDPFAFDEDEIVPSKWDTLSVVSGRPKGQQRQKRKPSCRDAEDGCLSQPMLMQDDCLSQPMLSQVEFGSEEQNELNHHSSDTSCTTSIDEESTGLLADCLLTTIKVLMNLTNDNAIGCQQIAASGGLEALSSLIARHFPSFGSPSSAAINKENSLFSDTVPELGSQTDVHLSDQELDFLVTILGLLVNMVENDGDNRSRLAATRVSVSCSGRLDETNTGLIPFLCSIFLANRGAGEGDEDDQSWDAEEVVLQGEKEAEKMIVEAYAALLLAFLSTESKSIRDSIASYLPDRSLKALVPVLDRFVTFHLTLNMISPETHKTVSEVIESCRLP